MLTDERDKDLLNRVSVEEIMWHVLWTDSSTPDPMIQSSEDELSRYRSEDQQLNLELIDGQNV